MAKIKLKLSSKKSDKESNDNGDHYIKQEVTSPKIKIKTPTSVSSSSTSLPKIKLKTLMDSSLSTNTHSLPTIKFKSLDDNAGPPLSSTTTTTATTGTKPLTKPKRTPTLRVKAAKLPGNGYDSEDPDKEEEPLVEEAIVLRFLPDETLDTVRAAVESAERGHKDTNSNSGNKTTDFSNISVTWSDKRRAIVRVGDIMYAAKLVNLPTISEVHKTIDRKNIFKTVDVSQMLLVVKRIYDEVEILELQVDKEYGETYPDGLTPPMEFAKNRFDKKYEAAVVQNVEDEVARLLKLDIEAESSVFEFIDADEENLVPMSVIEGKIKNKNAKKEKKRLRKERKILQKEKETLNSIEDGNMDNQFEDIDNELDRLMRDDENDGELDDEEEEEEEEEDDDDEEEEGEEEDNGNSGSNMIENPTKTESESDEDEDEEDDEDNDEDEDDNEIAMNTNVRLGGNDIDEFTQHSALLLEEIKELESTIAQKQRDLKKAINPIMKNRITDVISRLQQELDMKKSQAAAADEAKNKLEASKAENDVDKNKENDDEDDVDNTNNNNDEENEGSEAGDDDQMDVDQNENDVNEEEEEEEEEEDYDDLF